MNVSKWRPAAAGLALLLAMSAGAGAQAQAGADPAPLSRSLAQTASSAETGLPASSSRVGVRLVVEPKLQQLLITAGERPVLVRLALERVLRNCRPVGNKVTHEDDLSCPGRQGSYDALNDLLQTVIALIDQDQPGAAGAAGGGAPFGGAPGVGGGGSGPDYRVPS